MVFSRGKKNCGGLNFKLWSISFTKLQEKLKMAPIGELIAYVDKIKSEMEYAHKRLASLTRIPSTSKAHKVRLCKQ
jgi:hypothetical protein